MLKKGEVSVFIFDRFVTVFMGSNFFGPPGILGADEKKLKIWTMFFQTVFETVFANSVPEDR